MSPYLYDQRCSVIGSTVNFLTNDNTGTYDSFI